MLTQSIMNIWKNSHRGNTLWRWTMRYCWMCFEACTFDTGSPVCHALREPSILPFGFCTSFSIPSMDIMSLSSFVEVSFMLLWCPLTIIHDISTRIDFCFWTRTILSGWKLKFNRPFLDWRVNTPLEQLETPELPEVMLSRLEVLDLPLGQLGTLLLWLNLRRQPTLASMDQT